MEKLGGVVSRLRLVLRRGRVSREASDELHFHRELLVARYLESGRWFITSVLIRFGTSPTGMTAFTFMLAVSIAFTDMIAALEM